MHVKKKGVNCKMEVTITDTDKIIQRPFFLVQDGVTIETFIQAFEDIIKNTFETYEKKLSYKEYPENRAVCIEGLNNCTLYDWAILTKLAFASKVGALQVNGPSLKIPPQLVQLVETEIIAVEKNEKSCFVPYNKIYVKAKLRERMQLATVLKGNWKDNILIDDANSFDEIKDKLYPMFTASDLMFLKGSTGSCKTVAAIKIIKKYNCQRVKEGREPVKVLYFSNRIVFAKNTAKRINEINSWENDEQFELLQTAGCYKDGNIEETVKNNTFITQSTESLSKLYYAKGTPFSFSKIKQSKYILVIDEAPELLKTLVGPTVEHKDEACYIFQFLIRYARKTIVMSDDLNQSNVDSIASLIQETQPKSFIELQKKSLTAPTSAFCKSMEIAVNLIFEDLKAGKNLFIPSVTISKQNLLAELLMREFGDKFLKHCLFISAEQNADVAEKGVVNGVWDGFRLVSISPKISSGVSFDLKHFHKAYVFADPIIDIRTIKQMLGRVRILIENEVLHVLPERNILRNLPTEYDAVRTYHEDKANVGLDAFKQFFQGRFYHPKDEKYQFGDEFIERLVFQQLVEKHKEMNNFENEYVNHFIVECEHHWKSIDDYVFRHCSTSIIPTAVNEAECNLVSAKLKTKGTKEKCKSLANKIQELYQRFKTYKKMLEHYEKIKKTKGVDANNPDRKLEETALFLITTFDRKVLQSQTYDIVEDYIERKLDTSLFRNFEQFCQRIDEYDPSVVLYRFEKGILLGKDVEAWWLLQDIIKRLFSILWNFQVRSIEDIFSKIAQTWVFNPYRRVKKEQVEWLDHQCRTLIRCCFAISRSTFNESILYGNKEKKQYLFPHESNGEDGFDCTKPFGGIVKEIVIFNILNLILKQNFGFSIVKNRKDRVRYRPEDLEQLLTEHPDVKSVKEYKERLKLNGGACRLVLYEVSFDFERVYSLFFN